MSILYTERMDPKQPTDFWSQVWQLLIKNGTLIGSILLGLIGTFSYDLLRNKKFTRAYIVGCTGCALFMGYVGGQYVLMYYPTKAPFLIPFITLLSNNFVSALMAIDYKALLQKDWRGAFDLLFRNKDK